MARGMEMNLDRYHKAVHSGLPFNTKLDVLFADRKPLRSKLKALLEIRDTLEI